MTGEKRKVDTKICGVCGDKALGYNFNAVTCESCKAFFRRNALKNKEFKCPFDNNCKVDVITRRFCQRCRLKKCFDIGMKKEWIMTDAEKQEKRAKIEENRQKRGHQGKSSFKESEEFGLPCNLPSYAQSAGAVTIKPYARITGMPEHPVTSASEDEDGDPPAKVLRVANSFDVQPCMPQAPEEIPPPEYDLVRLEVEGSVTSQQDNNVNKDASSSKTTIMTQLLEEDNNSHDETQEDESLHDDDFCIVKDEGEAAAPSSLCCSQTSAGRATSTVTSSSSLENEQEASMKLPSHSRAEEGIIAPNPVSNAAIQVALRNEFTFIPIRSKAVSYRELSDMEETRIEELVVANEVLKQPLSFGKLDPSLVDVVNMTDFAIRRLIKMAKKINSFKNLCQEDQIALLKGGTTELMLLRSVMTYDPEKDCWKSPEGSKTFSIKLDVLKEARGNVYEEHKRFIYSFRPEWRVNERIMLLLGAISLFSPERPNIAHMDVIRLEQDTYYYLLRRYLETIYSNCEARSVFLRLIQNLQDLQLLNENHIRMLVDLDPREVEPLLIEIFDLK